MEYISLMPTLFRYNSDSVNFRTFQSVLCSGDWRQVSVNFTYNEGRGHDAGVKGVAGKALEPLAYSC